MIEQNNQQENFLEEGQTQEIDEDKIFHNLMEKVGTMGCYQIAMFLVFSILTIMCGGFSMITPFAFYQDPYDCSTAILPQGTTCTDYVCSLPSSQRQSYIPHPLIVSFANNFGDYRCNSEMNTVNLIETLMYAGGICGVILLTFLGTFISKKKIILISSIFSLIGAIMASYSVNMIMGGAGLLLCNFGGTVNFNLCYIYIIETFSENHRKTFAMAFPVLYCLGSFLNVLQFYLFPNVSTVLLYFYGIPLLFGVAGMIFLVKDAPIDIVLKDSPEQALKTLKFIARLNKKKQFVMNVQEMRQLQENYHRDLHKSINNPEKEKKFNISDLFRYKSLKIITILLALINVTTNLQYFTPSLMMSQFDFSIYINGVFIQSAQLISSIICCFISNCTPRRVLAICSFCVVLVCSLILIFIWDQDNQHLSDINSNLLVLTIVFILEFAITTEFNFFAIYVTELYPTQVRVIGIGCAQIFGSAILLVAEEIINACLRSGFRIMILFVLMAALSIVCSAFLPQSFGKIPPDIIEELKKRKINIPNQKPPQNEEDIY